MIRFPCTCGHLFQSADDTAGGAVQCPRCGRLNDIPYLSDLKSLAADGTYTLDSGDLPKQPNALAVMLHMYAKSKVDSDGNEIDLRGAAGVLDERGEYDLERPADPRSPPRYDPETGELVRPIATTHDAHQAPTQDPSTIPFAKATIGYATRGAMLPRAGTHVLLEVCQPHNVAVMFFILVAQLSIAVFFFFMVMGLFLILVALLPLVLALPAHFANVVDSVGPDEHDELPRPLRELRFLEDMWHPFMSMMGTILLCFLPAWLVLRSRMGDAAALAAGLPLALAGAFLFPAILLTWNTSGSFSNLRPDRLLGLVRACGRRYIGVVLLWAIAGPVWLMGMVGILLGATRIATYQDSLPKWVSKSAVVAPSLVVGVFLLHVAAWHTGLLYRGFHNHFPWVGRYHIREPRAPVQRRKPKYVNSPPPRPPPP